MTVNDEKPVAVARVTITFDVTIHDVSHYDASEPSAAVENMRMWYRDGTMSVIDDLSFAEKANVTVELITE